LIFVGDQNRVEKTQFLTANCYQKREFKKHGILKAAHHRNQLNGPDNIDIVINELDALVNIDLETRQPKKGTSLNIIRIGTSGSLQVDIPVTAL
jgi:uridine phosphorylase